MVTGSIGLGLALLAFSFFSERVVGVDYFWSESERVELAERDQRWIKLQRAFLMEQNRRREAGEPLMTTAPPSLEKARAGLDTAIERLDAARRSPARLARGLQLAGAALLALGVLIRLAPIARRGAAGPGDGQTPSR